jgi:processive 1,2-diacylglycerol beta-glucosyltransferase
MNILIWSGCYGMGHMSAAEAVKQQIHQFYPTAGILIADITEICFPHLNQSIYNCFNRMVKYVPGVFNQLNRLDAKKSYLPFKKECIKKWITLFLKLIRT